MMKISALNQESNDESEEENTASITKEAQEQLVLTEYNNALQLLKEDKVDDALAIFQELIETELLDQVEKPAVPDGRTRPMLSLKYCCYKNIASIYRKLGNYDAAIDHYWEAANLDDTDVMLWYTMGIMAMETCNLEFACSAFKQALICNSNHWPSLDNIITAMYAIPDYMNCLLYISSALERDNTYIKGLIFREKIFQEFPYFQESYKLFNGEWERDPPLNTDFDRILGDKLLKEAQELADKWIEICKDEFQCKPIPDLTVNVPLQNFTWLELGECLIDMYEYIVKNNLSFASKVRLDVERPIEKSPTLTLKEPELNENIEEELKEKDQKEEESNNIATVDEENRDDGAMMIVDISSEVESVVDIEIENSKCQDEVNSIDQCYIDPDVTEIKVESVQMDVDVIDEDDDKSSSSDIHIIEDEDPLNIHSFKLEKPEHLENGLSSHNNSDGSDGLNNSNRNDDDIEIIRLSSDECPERDKPDTDKDKSESEKSKEDDAKSKDEIKEDGDQKPNDTDNDAETNATSTSRDEVSKITKEEQQKVKKRRRSSLCFLQQWAWSSSSMRRSARVRGSNRREVEREDVQLEEIMRGLFPPNLLPDNAKIIRDDPIKSMDDSMDTMDLYQLFANQDKTNNNTDIDADNVDDADDESKTSSEGKSPNTEAIKNVFKSNKLQYFDTEREKDQVMAFIHEHSGKSNIMMIIGKLTDLLAIKWNYLWPNALSDTYQRLYLFTRRHIPHNNSLLYDFNDVKNEEENVLMYDPEMTLLFSELYTDKWLDNKPDISSRSTIDKFGIGLPTEELGYIIFSTVRHDESDLANVDNLLYLLRVLWVKVSIFLCQGDTKIAIKTLELIVDIMENCQSKFPNEITIKLPNCKYNSRIMLSTVKKRLTSIERGEKLGQVQKLYEGKKYYELSCILKDTFKLGKSSKRHNERTLFMNNVKLINIDRAKQFSMLLESLWQLEQYEDCYSWCELCLNEAWQYYINESDDDEQKKWSASLLNCLEKLESCVEMAGTSVARYLPEARMVRLIQTLIQIICHQLDVSENTVEMPLETVIPWILLHHILQYQDDKERALRSRNAQKNKKKSNTKKVQDQNGNAYNSDSSSNTIESNPDKENIPPPIKVLFIGHDFLGRHSWCCINEAKLLIFTIKTVIPCLRSPRYNSVREKISKHLEQIFWCLYGHPNRANKTKPKHLEDHGVPQVPLTWDISQLLFEFYRPEVLPEFDTPRPLSITSDTKLLFKRINILVPPEHDPSGMVDQITAHIVGDLEKMPTVKKPLPYQIDSLYYLLGDYSFKNNNWSSATRYYTMDICLHPHAFNSWVALAMSVSTLIGTTLNNCKPLTDIMKLLSQAKVAQCCYQHAVELKPGHSVIWIEYGNFVYTVHSFCSRLLKQESDTLSMEKFAILETRKEDSLEIAANCFVSANRIYLANIDDSPHMQDERWLYHYMLAKIAEKKNADPSVFLQHYATASELLHKNNAHYPKKISHKNAHYLSIEALEVHYRIHACILKYFEQHECKPLKKSLGILFTKHLMDCANGPFMQFQSKLSKNKYYRDETYEMATKVYQDKLASEKSPEMDDNVMVIDDNDDQKKFENDVVVISSDCDKNDVNKVKVDISNSRKRARVDQETESSKRIKLSSVSHLQLMQAVVGLIDDLISNVCDIVTLNDKQDTEDIMIISSDDGEPGEGADECSKIIQKSSCKNHLNENELEKKNPEQIRDEDIFTKQPVEQDKFQSVDSTTTINNKDKYAKDSKGISAIIEKKKTAVSSVKDEATMSRRGSQESTTTTLTTTTTETNNSSFSSSDETSSSEDSSDSDSSSGDSDSETGESDADKKKATNEENEKEEEVEAFFPEAEVSRLISFCLAGLEQCVLRFPEHYKSLYRLCHFYFNHKAAKDNTKCRDLLLETYKCQYYNAQTFQGLFADRKSSNFFNGVWRIPNDEIDRPGSFASHMSRCVTLLLQVLKETDDSRMLMELCILLRKTPDADKKYVRDSEREQLSRQAFSLCLQSLRTRVQSMGPPKPDDNSSLARTDPRTQVLLDVYKIYQQVQKNFQGKEVQAFATLFVDTYKVYMDVKTSDENILDMALRYCQQQNLANKIAASQLGHHSHYISTSLPNISSSISSNSTTVTAVTAIATANTSINTVNSTPATSTITSASINSQILQNQSMITSPHASYQRKPYKSSGTGRPRGRPPNTNKYPHLQSGNVSNSMNQYDSKRGFANYLGTSGNQSLINPYFMSPLLDQNIMSMFTAGLAGNMLDPLASANYLKNFGNYQEILRQYQSNLASISNSLTSNFNNPTMSIPANTTVGVSPANITPITNISGIGSLGSHSGSTEIPHNISITPVNPINQSKPLESLKHGSESGNSKNMYYNKPTPSLGVAQVSLLKSSQNKVPAKSSTTSALPGQIRVAKNLTDPQPAHNLSVPVSPLKTSSPSNIMAGISSSSIAGLQSSGLNIKPVPAGMGRLASGTSLQHKLQLKKQSQPAQTSQLSTARKQKSISNKPISNYPTITSHYQGNVQGTVFGKNDLSGLSVSAVHNPDSTKTSVIKQHANPKKIPTKHKPSSIDITESMQSCLPSHSSALPGTSAETLNMLSQLQQHSHLEIIPQSKSQNSKTMPEYSKNLPLSLSVLPQKPVPPKNIEVRSDMTTVFEMPREKSVLVTSSPKKSEKNTKDSVEIITLDD